MWFFCSQRPETGVELCSEKYKMHPSESNENLHANTYSNSVHMHNSGDAPPLNKKCNWIIESKKKQSPKLREANFELFAQYDMVDNRFSQFRRYRLFDINDFNFRSVQNRIYFVCSACEAFVISEQNKFSKKCELNLFQIWNKKCVFESRMIDLKRPSWLKWSFGNVHINGIEQKTMNVERIV